MKQVLERNALFSNNKIQISFKVLTKKTLCEMMLNFFNNIISGNFILLIAQTKKLRIILDFFVSPKQPSEIPVSSIFKIYPEPSHLSPPLPTTPLV